MLISISMLNPRSARRNVVMVRDMLTNVMMVDLLVEMVAVLIAKSSLDTFAEVGHQTLLTVVLHIHQTKLPSK